MGEVGVLLKWSIQDGGHFEDGGMAFDYVK